MPYRRFKQVDVFTQKPFLGNPVAVVIDAQGLNTEEMQRIAAWTNLSETTFVFPPSAEEADYRLRIFSPKQELPFAGHPTIGSAHAVIESGFVAMCMVLGGLSCVSPPCLRYSRTSAVLLKVVRYWPRAERLNPRTCSRE